MAATGSSDFSRRPERRQTRKQLLQLFRRTQPRTLRLQAPPAQTPILPGPPPPAGLPSNSGPEPPWSPGASPHPVPSEKRGAGIAIRCFGRFERLAQQAAPLAGSGRRLRRQHQHRLRSWPELATSSRLRATWPCSRAFCRRRGVACSVLFCVRHVLLPRARCSSRSPRPIAVAKRCSKIRGHNPSVPASTSSPSSAL